jgi:hypothetical protein
MASALPSGLKHTEPGGVTAGGKSVTCALPVARSHNLPASAAEASVLPSGLKHTAITPPRCPSSVAWSLRVTTSHTLIVWSKYPAEACSVPSRLKHTARTEDACPDSVARSLAVTTTDGFDLSTTFSIVFTGWSDGCPNRKTAPTPR